MTEVEVLAWLGPPDYGDSDERGAEYFYLYEKVATKARFANLSFGPDGSLSRIGWNTTSTLALERLRRYQVVPFADLASKKHTDLGPGYLGLQIEALLWRQDGYLYIGSYGVEVTSVAADSPASRAGIQKGDRITAIDGARFEARGFQEDISRLKPGQTVTLRVLRNLKGTAADEKEFKVVVGTRRTLR